jgi:hypothetical protein
MRDVTKSSLRSNGLDSQTHSQRTEANRRYRPTFRLIYCAQYTSRWDGYYCLNLTCQHLGCITSGSGCRPAMRTNRLLSEQSCIGPRARRTISAIHRKQRSISLQTLVNCWSSCARFRDQMASQTAHWARVTSQTSGRSRPQMISL